MGEDKKVTVEITHSHEHGGKFLQPGALIDVYPDTANWLISHEFAKKATRDVKKVLDVSKHNR